MILFVVVYCQLPKDVCGGGYFRRHISEERGGGEAMYVEANFLFVAPFNLI